MTAINMQLPVAHADFNHQRRASAASGTNEVVFTSGGRTVPYRALLMEARLGVERRAGRGGGERAGVLRRSGGGGGNSTA